MNAFYHLTLSDKASILEWDERLIVHDPYVRCPLDDGHPRIGRIRVNDLHVVLRSKKVTDIAWTWMSECLVRSEVADLFVSAGFTGFELKPVHVSSTTDASEHALPSLQELKVLGWGGVAPEESGIQLLEKCPGCEMIDYSAVEYPERLVDANQWDGSDFFFVWPLPRFVMVTARVKELIVSRKLSGASVLPLSEFAGGREGLAPRPLWHYVGKERAEIIQKQAGGKLP